MTDDEVTAIVDKWTKSDDWPRCNGRLARFESGSVSCACGTCPGVEKKREKIRQADAAERAKYHPKQETNRQPETDVFAEAFDQWKRGY